MKIGIIGAGPAGIMAAITAASNGNKVIVIEHNERVGRKILSTGNGRCNLTNLQMSISNFHGANAGFAEKIINRFNELDTIRFFEDLGLYTKNKNDYIYPYSENASTVLDCLRFKLESMEDSIDVLTDTHVSHVEKQDVFKVFTVNGSVKKTIKVDKLIIATGSKAASKLGSDGSGYEIARTLGHKIVKPLPALCGLKSRDDFLKQIAGIRNRAKALVEIDGKEMGYDTGEIQFNKDGISGIPVMQLSYIVSKALDQRKKVNIVLDFFPELSEEKVSEFLMNKRKLFDKHPVNDLFIGMLHKNLSNVIVKRAALKKDCGDLTDSEISELVKLCKCFNVDISGINGFDNAQVCCGGIDVNELKDTLESKIISNLYFAGEIIDINGDCGGYNLQWAWSSGFVSGGIG